MAIAFAIPVWKELLPLMIILLVLNWLVAGEYIKTVPLIFKEKQRTLIFSFSFLYFLYLIGLIHTTNFQYAREDLELKLSMLIFPLIFATSEIPAFSAKETGLVLRSFGAGCIAGSLILIGRAVYQSVFIHEAGAFYYTSLGWNFHPSYYAMYLVFALSNIIYFVFIRKSVHGFPNMAMHIAILLFFTLMVVLLSSKAGLLVWLSVVGFYIAILIFKYKRWHAGMGFGAVAVAVFILFLIVFPTAAGRISQAKQDIASADTTVNAGRSTGDRVLIWKSSKEIIRQNFLFGVGTGDIRDKLTEEYNKSDAMGALKHYLNAHNQYVQTLIAIGLAGLLVLLTMIIAPAILALKRENYLYFAFLFIFGISMFFESMFERQEGVVFYLFFNTLLFSMGGVDPD
jgi:O-antigen ligase